MAKKDQVKIFFCACIADDPFVLMLKKAKIPIQGWSYIKAIRLWRDRIDTFVKSKLSDPDRQIKAAINKATDIFKKMPYNKVSVEMYINFCLSLAEDISEKITNKTEKKLWTKVIENLFKLYLIFDPDIKDDKEIDKALEVNKLVWEVF